MRYGANVTGVGPKCVTLSDQDTLEYGLLVWNTGLAPQDLISSLPSDVYRKDKWGHLVVDDRMRVLRAQPPATGDVADAAAHTTGSAPPASASPPPDGEVIPGVFCIGDAAHVQPAGYAATAQVAEQQVCGCRLLGGHHPLGASRYCMGRQVLYFTVTVLQRAFRSPLCRAPTSARGCGKRLRRLSTSDQRLTTAWPPSCRTSLRNPSNTSTGGHWRFLARCEQSQTSHRVGPSPRFLAKQSPALPLSPSTGAHTLRSLDLGVIVFRFQPIGFAVSGSAGTRPTFKLPLHLQWY